MDFSTTITHESQALPGVSFTVRRLNVIERAKRDAKMLPARSRYSDILDRMRTLSVDPDADDYKSAPGKENQFNAAWSELIHVENGEIRPAYIRAGLVSVDGLTIDGAAPTVEAFLAGAPDPLIIEVFAACRAASDLQEELRKNSESPTTSDAAADGQASDTTAPVAVG